MEEMTHVVFDENLSKRSLQEYVNNPTESANKVITHLSLKKLIIHISSWNESDEESVKETQQKPIEI